ncbi:enoyl-CoA hydratase/isomerase family protein [Natronorubrum halophilum]|uniref:enoyl-CoA hydratase/isomerase family protein n=1 Tax=Natronorubrum halophilum TaxID=1702106 RepID=UPI001EE7B15B|nr:enoyl-CoA hydratase/isomerase family protein [Natronorubrum halophilum]
MSSKTFETIDWSFDEQTGIGRIVLDRPDKLNALSKQCCDEIIAGLQRFEHLDEEGLYEEDNGVKTRIVILEGAGEDAFCVGSDVDEFHDVKPGVFNFNPMFTHVEQFPAPIIAKIDGYCLGGGLELALSCDFRVASEESEFGFPEIQLGIMPGDGGTQRLPEIVGPSRTKELAMTAEHIDADDALEDGIVDYVHSRADLESEVFDFAGRIAEQPPLAVRAIKDSVNISQETNLRVGRYYERRAGNWLTATEDHEEGVQAFEEKRDPNWAGQ